MTQAAYGDVDLLRVAGSARAASSPHSAAAVPECGVSPVRGLCWNTAPRAKEPGVRPA